MKKWGIVLMFIFIAGYVGADQVLPFFQNEVNIEENTKDGVHNTVEQEIEERQIYQGDLLLVNENHPVHRGSIREDIVDVYNHPDLTENYVLLDADIQLSAEIAEKFSSMVAAAEQEGVHRFLISSGYRSFEEQGQLYKEMASDYALPAGHSEHNLGLSLDVGSSQGEMRTAPEGKWIENNAWKHGFVLRYPKDKKEITGISYEPWHIRYVGLPHSAIMYDRKMVLEEYLEYLQEEKTITAEVEDKKYTVSYYPDAQTETIDLPEDGDYAISGDNVGGVIVTVEK
ncbi:D-Ala-D-Ala carboxypeptidase VanY [Salibacterium aidingense]|uniref:D-Ala-D-Ala carboxypeptidase VanY n=1 Tax=Salibacterium aidingense TaxID=384933 RepID=UPI0004139550|nr:D-Ala-D-Ala carboxypeptidase VanY [Salibacterium aidingense]